MHAGKATRRTSPRRTSQSVDAVLTAAERLSEVEETLRQATDHFLANVRAG